MAGIKLVMGASGFLGSHVTRQLVEQGDRVRVWIRRTSSTEAFDDLDVERCYGDLDDAETLASAMDGVDTVFYCIVDARAWLHDPAPLWATNVEGLRGVLDVAVATSAPRFVFCSTIGTIAMVEDGLADETMPHNWLHRGGDYVQARYAAEQLVLEAGRERGLDVVVLCVATTYGPRDLAPTPHGGLVVAASRGWMPFYVRDVFMEVVGIEDAARAFLLAETRGRPGERYIVSERFMSIRELVDTAAAAGGARPAPIGVPLWMVRVAGRIGGWVAGLLRWNVALNPTSVRLMHEMSPLDHSKAVRELGWEPQPTPEAVRAGARFAQRAQYPQKVLRLRPVRRARRGSPHSSQSPC